MNYTIEKGIPIPPRRASVWANYRDSMEIGNSMVVSTKKDAHSFSVACTNGGFHCSVRRQPDGKYRVWKGEKK